MKIFSPFTFIIRSLARKMSIVSEEMDLSCDFDPFFKRMLLCVQYFYIIFLQKVSKGRLILRPR